MRGHSMLVVLLVGCWSSPPPKPEPYWIPPKPEEPKPTPVACAKFDEHDPACDTVCRNDAPDDWKGCETLAAQLQAGGYVCSNLHPRTCKLAPIPACPPGGCVGFDARVVKISIVGGLTELTVVGGQLKGVTTAWKAHLVVQQGGAPVAGGEIKLTRIDRNVSVGTTALTWGQISALYVRLEP